MTVSNAGGCRAAGIPTRMPLAVRPAHLETQLNALARYRRRALRQRAQQLADIPTIFCRRQRTKVSTQLRQRQLVSLRHKKYSSVTKWNFKS